MQNENLIMTAEPLWFALGFGSSLLAGAGIWVTCLIAKTLRQKKQICGLMQDKGALTMRVSILETEIEDNNKERYDKK